MINNLEKYFILYFKEYNTDLSRPEMGRLLIIELILTFENF